MDSAGWLWAYNPNRKKIGSFILCRSKTGKDVNLLLKILWLLQSREALFKPAQIRWCESHYSVRGSDELIIFDELDDICWKALIVRSEKCFFEKCSNIILRWKTDIKESVYEVEIPIYKKFNTLTTGSSTYSQVWNQNEKIFLLIIFLDSSTINNRVSITFGLIFTFGIIFDS